MKSIDNLLSEMTIEQKAPIVKILGLKSNDNNLITEKLSKILLPAKGLFQSPLNYNEFLLKIAKANNEEVDFTLGDIKAETDLYIKLFQQEFEKLSQNEKDKIYLELEKAGLDKNQIASLSGISALGAAQLSGIGVYLLASSTVGAITSVLGITLPFAFYTGMSSVISFVIGPVGFLVMGVMIYRSFKNVKSWDEAVDILKASWGEMKSLALGDYVRGTLAFKYLAASRVILLENLKNEIEKNNLEIEDEKRKIEAEKKNISLVKNKSIKISEEKIKEEQIASTIEEEISKKNTELKQVNLKINTLKSEIKQLDSEIIYVDNNISLKEVSIKGIEQKNTDTEMKINKLRT